MFSRDMTRVLIIARHTPVKLYRYSICPDNHNYRRFRTTPRMSLNFLCFLSSAVVVFFKIIFFDKILSEIPSEYQTVWFQIRPDIFVGPDLGPHYFQGYIVSADAISGQ